MAREQTTSANLLGDDPRDGSIERPDELDRSGFAQYLVHLLESVSRQSDSSVMALIGDWGAGKSSILGLLRRKLEGATWRLAEFNPWTYPDPVALQRGFFAELMSALPPDDRPSGTRRKIGEFARTISPLGSLGNLISIDGKGALDTLADHLIGDTSATAAKRLADEALRRADQRVLMIIDDLDRLTPDELLEVLKFVRLIGRLPHVYYLLCYDERTLLDVLVGTPLAGGDERRARAYLEKIVQVRLDIPALRASQRTSLLNRGLDSIRELHAIRLTASDEQRLSDIYFSALDQRLSTPRAINRFLGQIQAFYGPLREEVDFVDFLLVSWLRTVEPGVYAMLLRERDALLGHTRELLTYGRRDSSAAEQRQKRWKDRLVAARVEPDHMDGVVRVLSKLLPEIRAAFSSTNSFTSPSQRTTPRAISDPDYFDRYVSFGVPADDLADSTVRRALDALEHGRSSAALDTLIEQLRTETARTTRKIDALRDAGPIPDRAIFQLLARLWADLDDNSTGLFDRPQRAVERAAGMCLLTLAITDAIEVAETSATDAGSRELVANAVRYIVSDARSPYRSSVPADYEPAPLIEVAARALRRAQEGELAESPFDPGVMRRFWTWQALDTDDAQAWLRAQVDDGRWALRDVIGALTSVTIPIGVANPRQSIGEFALDMAGEVFTFQRLFRDLAVEIDNACPVAIDSTRDVEATPANRTEHALYALKLERARRTPPDPTEPEGPPQPVDAS